MTIARILAIAGSDSGGGAGIQADIKTITLLGGHAMTAVTAITAQNTAGVSRIAVTDREMVRAQIAAVVGDIGVDAVKIGMIGSAENGAAVAGILDRSIPIVLDPVMIATSGAALADSATVAGLVPLMERAILITPNVDELASLTGMIVADVDAMAAAAEMLARRHGCAVLAKGGHLAGEPVVDLMVGRDGQVMRWTGHRIATRHHHGTGCTLSSAIATGLGQGADLVAAIGRARALVRAALVAAPGLGHGNGPLGLASLQPPFRGDDAHC